MRITAPVTDYIQKSILTTYRDVVARGVALPERVPGPTGNYQFLGYKGSGPGLEFADLFRAHAAEVNLNYALKAGGVSEVGSDDYDEYLKIHSSNYTAVFEKLHLKHTGVYTNNTTRSTAGSQAITGVGFEPSTIIVITTDSSTGNLNFSIAFHDGTRDRCFHQYNNGTAMNTANSLIAYIRRDASNILSATTASLDSDGFTLTWSLTGTVTAEFNYLCLP